MARQFTLDRKEAELLIDLLEANIGDPRFDQHEPGIGTDLLLALKKEFGMIKELSE